MLRCDHCLLEFPEREAVRDALAGADRVFCCNGCRGVYRLILEEGLQGFYAGREWKDAGLAADPEGRLDLASFAELVRDGEGRCEVDLYIDGIRCASCVWLNERLLSRTPGVLSARVNYATHRARVRWDPARTDLAAVLRRVQSIGYAPKPYSESEQARARSAETRDLLIRFGTAGFLSSQLMIYSVALYAGYFQGIDAGTRRLLELVALGLTLPVFLYSGAPFLRGARAGLRHGRVDMDGLIVLGSGAALAYSLWQMARGGEVYFDTAAMIVTLVLLGRYIEAAAKGKASEAVVRLAALVPREARAVVEGEGGREERRPVAVASLRPGDRLEVLPGERVPADGRVVRGDSEVDESLLTGESRPVHKAPGAAVVGGSVNLHGAFVLEVTRVGRDSVLAAIVRAVEEAQQQKPRIQALADRVVGIFVPAVLLLAAATVAFHLWRGSPAAAALMTGISVVVIACPCALGLATPLAVLLASGLASSRGVLLRGGDVIEKASRLDDAVLDKTGTLTRGRPALRQALSLDPALPAEEGLALAAAVERRSEHSLGRAIAAAGADAPEREVAGFRAIPGRGVTAVVDGRPLSLGNRALLREQGIDPGPSEETARGFESQGDTVVLLGWDGRVQALFAVSDPVRDEAAEALARLRALGLRLSVVSGDNPATTSSVAARLGIERAVAEASPDGKRDLVAALQREGRRVLAIGDGVNDAPVLTQADVGVAMGRGSDVTLESADAVLLRDDLRLLPGLVGLSRRAHAVIRQNVFWAFLYNVVAIPLAMAGALHPIVAAAAMATSSLFVVGNSLRIRNAWR
jgi:Cu2+-exporting ATPase